MFTIKRQLGGNGKTSCKAAESYDKEVSPDSAKITLHNKGSEENLVLTRGSGDVVYVENIAGKTVDVIRAPR